MTDTEMIREIRELADRFSEGWHEGIKIDASDVVLLSNTATALEQLAALKAERDELLAALKSVVSEAVRLRWSVHPKWLQIMNTANAAIAKAEGGAA